MTLDLVKFVSDQNHGDTTARETTNDLKQPLRFGIGQDRGRLIENENSRAPDQHLDDLHLLLLGDRKVSDAPFGVDVEPELRRLLANVVANISNAGAIRRLGIRQQ